MSTSLTLSLYIEQVPESRPFTTSVQGDTGLGSQVEGTYEG